MKMSNFEEIVTIDKDWKRFADKDNGRPPPLWLAHIEIAI